VVVLCRFQSAFGTQPCPTVCDGAQRKVGTRRRTPRYNRNPFSSATFPSSPGQTMNDDTRLQAIAIAAAIFAARDLANCNDPKSPRAANAIEDAIYKARYLLEIIARKLSST
jgi:hypothetical protein